MTDFPGENEPFALTTDAHVDRNTAFGNSSDAAGPVDLWVASIEELASVSRNSCGSSIPDPAWCDG